MFEQSTPLLLSAAFTSTQVLVIAVLSALVVVLGVAVAALRRKARIQLGPIVIDPSPAFAPKDNGETTGPYPLPGLSTEETEPFDLEEINKAMKASETLRAIEALRAAEAQLAAERLARAKSRESSVVRTIRMGVCPLCVLYEVSGNAPKAHIVPSDMRVVEVGRASDCQIRSNQPNVSQRHFRLHLEPRGTPGRWAGYEVELEDCGSRNGTWLNGKRAEPGERLALQDGDIVEAASVRFLFYFVLRGDS